MEWQPKSYTDHFRDSSFTAKELAIEAYGMSPPEYRGIFDHTVVQMDMIVHRGLARISELVNSNKSVELQSFATNLSRALQSSIDITSAIIHGAKTRMAQGEIDELLRS